MAIRQEKVICLALHIWLAFLRQCKCPWESKTYKELAKNIYIPMRYCLLKTWFLGENFDRQVLWKMYCSYKMLRKNDFGFSGIHIIHLRKQITQWL